MSMERVALAPGYDISRVIRGGWQLAGGHGAIDRDGAVDDLLAAFDAGITTFDCADIYTGVEELYGRFRRRLHDERGSGAIDRLRIHTKLVPDLDRLPTVDRPAIEAIVDQSRRRLQADRLDLVQFHWWDYEVNRYLDVVGWLGELRRAGKIEHIGLTNFDTKRTREILASGVEISSLQVQYSLLDRRVERALLPLARRHGLALFCYGTVAGGFLGERWLGRSEPQQPLENRSLTKYKLVIDDFGGWELFQDLLAAARSVAERHGTDIATVASRVVLDRPGITAVIIGARDRSHLASNVEVGSLRLTEEDRAQIGAVLGCANPIGGDFYEAERDRAGRHGSIMKYNLNAEVLRRVP
jgi:aryl-alcohol dehydrogenase-like predicted oxidoreductase